MRGGGGAGDGRIGAQRAHASILKSRSLTTKHRPLTVPPADMAGPG